MNFDYKAINDWLFASIIFVLGIILGGVLMKFNDSTYIDQLEQENKQAAKAYQQVFEDRQRYYNAWKALINKSGNGG